MNQTAVIYARYSSHSQRDVSIDQQIRACRQYAERNGIDVLQVYEDHALTGTNDRRPGFQKMIREASSADWDYVIVYTLDRFARDRYDSAVYKRQLKSYGIRVLSAMENISDDPTGVLMESLLEGLAEYYSVELSRKVRRGMDDNAAKCMVNGYCPLGLTRGSDGRYAIVESEAAVIREIFRRVADGDPFVDIINDFNARGLRTRRGARFNRSSFNQILTNERYAGVYIYGSTRIPGGIPAIISRELFDRVQQNLGTRKNPRKSNAPQRRRRQNGVYLLTGKLFCGLCKAPMIGVSGNNHSGNPYFYYVCKNKHDKRGCDKRNVRRDWIEELIADQLKRLMFTPEAMTALADAAIAWQNSQPESSDVANLQQSLADVTRSIGNLIHAMEMGVISDSTQSRLMELEQQKADFSRALNIAQADADQRLTRDDIIATLELFKDGNISDPSYQAALIDTFLVAAYVYDDELKIVFTLGKGQTDVSVPFDIDSVSPDVCINSRAVDQRKTSQMFYLAGFLLSCTNLIAVLINFDSLFCVFFLYHEIISCGIESFW